MMVFLLLLSLALFVVSLVSAIRWALLAVKKKPAKNAKRATLGGLVLGAVCLVASISMADGGAAAKMPVIAGSDATDIVLDLQQTAGLEENKTVAGDGSITYAAANEKYSYSILTDASGAIANAQFYYLGGNDTEGFLSHCATMPYDGNDAEAASKWVESNLGADAQTEIGGAQFEVSQGSTGPILRIFANGIDQYLSDKLIEE